MKGKSMMPLDEFISRTPTLPQEYVQGTGKREFTGFGKISRLNRDIVISEKIDGSNGAIGINEDGEVWAQSRTRILSSGKGKDNFGFAAWVEKHAELLKSHLGPGLHFGEWWGLGIQRGYDMSKRVFSLFNTSKWRDEKLELDPNISVLQELGVDIDVVPVLYVGPWERLRWVWYWRNNFVPDQMIDYLQHDGSSAAPGYMKPEGIIIYHTAGNVMFKATVEGDEKHKGET